MTEELKQPLSLTRNEEQELRIYFFIGQKKIIDIMPFTPPQVDKTIIYVWEFKLESAFEKAKLKATKQGGYDLTFTGQTPTVREFLRELELETMALQILAEPKPPEEKQEESLKNLHLTSKQISFEQFKSSIIMAAVEFVEEEEDRQTLKRIISNLKYEKLNL